MERLITHTTFGPPHAVLNLSKIGLRYFRIGIRASDASQERLVNYFVKHPNVGWVFTAKRYITMVIGIWAKDNAEINDLGQQVRLVLTSDDEIVFQSELTSLYSFGNRPAGKESAPMQIIDAVAEAVTLSPLEIDYLKLVALDSSTDDKGLASLLSVDEATVTHLHKKLAESGVIAGYQERITYQGVYYKLFIDTLSAKNSRAVGEFVATLWKDKRVMYFERANSKYDLEFEIIVSDIDEALALVSDFATYEIAELTENIYTNLYPVNKVANVREAREALLGQDSPIVDLRNSKLWYLSYAGAEAYLDIYEGNKEYFEVMEKSELDLFPQIATYLHQHHGETLYSILDIGSGNGLKGKIFIEKFGESRVKAYYPIDIQPIELAITMKGHTSSTYAKHPTLLSIESLGTRFPLTTNPGERQVYIFLGGTYGNFPREIINGYLKPLAASASSSLLIAIPLVGENKTKDDIKRSYVSDKFDSMLLGLLSQLGFVRSNFKENDEFPGFLAHHEMIDKSLVASLILREDVVVSGKTFTSGTRFRITTSWKPHLAEFKETLEKDFVVKHIFRNDGMAIALVEGLST